MDKFVSRSEVFAKEIEETNKQIETLKNQTRNDEFLSGIITSLNQIDKTFFEEEIYKANESFDVFNYYIDKDKNKEIINQEILHMIESYIETLVSLTPDSELMNNNYRVKDKTKLDQDSLTNVNLQELKDKMQQIIQEENLQIKNAFDISSIDSNLATSSYEQRVLEGLIKQNMRFSTPELMKITKSKMSESVTKISNQKSKYKIKYKSFFIVIPFLIVLMVLCLLLPFFI